MAELTEQQRAAVFRRDVSVVLSSGAGCGKTHVLTQRYLSHLTQDGAEVSQIVAITFTDRAARQMRQRIRAAVVGHLQAADSDAEAARWERHLRGLETAQISTIHAFCGTLLRQHAVEADLDPRFEVLEDYLAVNLESDALMHCLQGLLTAQSQAGADLCQLVLLYGWRPVVTAVRHLVRTWDGAWTPWLQHSPPEVAAGWQQHAREELLPRYAAYLSAGAPKVARCLWLLGRTPCSGPKMAPNVRRLLDETPRLAEAADLAAAVAELKEAAKVGPERAKAWPSEEVYAAVKDALADFREELPKRLKLFHEEAVDLPAAATVGQQFLRVAEEAARAYRQLKRRHGVVDFQDLLVGARDLLCQRPDVRERLQHRFRFLLIDELQDTDPVQMELVHALCGSELTSGKLFAVGDHAQSIYRFRRADVHLFQRLRQQMPPDGQLGLTRNFRSQPAILDFVNALFGPGSSAASGLEDYEPLRPHRAQVNPEPCIEFLWNPCSPDDDVVEARKGEAERIARRLAVMIGRGERLVTDEHVLRPVRAGDIVLLFRAMTDVELYETALRRHGLDYYLVGGRAFFAQQEIYDLLNLLRTLENPQDGVSVAGTLRSPFCCLSDETLFALSRHPDGIWAGLHDEDMQERLPPGQEARVLRARQNLDRWRTLKDRLKIARLLGKVFADSAYDAAVQFEFLGDRKLANLWKLVDMARDFDRTGLFSLAEFIARLGDLVGNPPREEQAATQPESADVVRLMTIHQAKGLEFPVVVVPDLAARRGERHLPAAHWDARLGCIVRPPDDDEPPFADFAWRLWSAGEEVENWREGLRTLYVACTRAEDYLILSAALKPDGGPESPWMLALAERFDLRSGRCLVPNLAAERLPRVRVFADDLADEAQERPRAERPAILPVVSPLLTLSLPQALPRICTVSELEDLLAGSRGGIVAYQWDAEDGSDRSAWLLPGERLETTVDPAAALRERLLRLVLEGWEFADVDGWRPLLRRAIAAQSRPEAVEAVRPPVEQTLAAFARCATIRRLAEARTCHRQVEFALPLAPGVQVRGLIDCLWEDKEGDWHLLVCSARATPQRLGMILAALAARQQSGAWPRTANHYGLGDGKEVCRDGRRLPHRKLLDELQLALRLLS